MSQFEEETTEQGGETKNVNTASLLGAVVPFRPRPESRGRTALLPTIPAAPVLPFSVSPPAPVLPFSAPAVSPPAPVTPVVSHPALPVPVTPVVSHPALPVPVTPVSPPAPVTPVVSPPAPVTPVVSPPAPVTPVVPAVPPTFNLPEAPIQTLPYVASVGKQDIEAHQTLRTFWWVLLLIGLCVLVLILVK